MQGASPKRKALIDYSRDSENAVGRWILGDAWTLGRGGIVDEGDRLIMERVEV